MTQPSFIYHSGDRYRQSIPKDRFRSLYRIASMKDMGLTIGFSSDAPVVDPNPIVGISAAFSRSSAAGWPVVASQRTMLLCGSSRIGCRSTAKGAGGSAAAAASSTIPLRPSDSVIEKPRSHGCTPATGFQQNPPRGHGPEVRIATPYMHSPADRRVFSFRRCRASRERAFRVFSKAVFHVVAIFVADHAPDHSR